MTNVLLVDSDLGFTFWLGQLLDEANYEAFPAKNIADAIQLLDQLKFPIDLLVLNPAMEGASSFAAVLRHAHPQVKIVAVYDPEIPGERVEMDASRAKTPRVDAAARAEWLNFFRTICKPVVGRRG